MVVARILLLFTEYNRVPLFSIFTSSRLFQSLLDRFCAQVITYEAVLRPRMHRSCNEVQPAGMR